MTTTLGTVRRSRWPWQTSIQWRLIIVVLIVVIIPVVAIFAFSFLQTADTLQQNAAADVRSLATSVTTDLERYLFERRGDITVLSQSETLTSGTDTVEAQTEFLKTYKDIYQAYESLYLTDVTGTIRAATNDISGDYSAEDWFKSARDSKTLYVSDVYLSREKGIVLTISAPVFADDGAFMGVVAGNVDVNKLIEIVGSTKIGENGEVVIVNKLGRIAIDPDIAVIFKDVNHLKGVQAALRGETGTITDVNDDGDPALVYYVPNVTTENWIAFVNVPIAELNAPVQALATRAALLGLLGILIITGAILYVARRIVQPIQQLTRVAGRLSAGEFKTAVPVQSADEIGQLANAFRVMSGELQGLVDTLESRVESRTRDLATTIEVGRLANSIYSQEELLPQLVEYIRSKFDLYYTQIYLLDEAQRYAILRAGTGEVGQQLLARHHRLNLEETSLVARAVKSREAVIVSDTASNPSHKPNALLPETRSETAVPLLVGDTILGVLDMQANRSQTFKEDNASVFLALGGQIAAVLRGAQAFAEVQDATSRAETINQRLTNETWMSYLGDIANGQRVGYEYNLEAPQLINDDRLHAPAPEEVVEPIVVRGAKIGNIVVKNDDSRFQLQADDAALVQETARRVAQALEQFRAFDEVKRSEELLTLRNQAIESSTSGITIADARLPDMPLIYVNEAFTRVTGYSIEEALGRNCRFLQNDDRDQEGLIELRTALKEGRPSSIILRNYRKNGELFYNELSTSPVFDSNNVITHFVGVSNDITQRVLQEQAIDDQRNRAELLGLVNAALTQAVDEEQVLTAVGVILDQEGYERALLSFVESDANQDVISGEIVAARLGNGDHIPLDSMSSTKLPPELLSMHKQWNAGLQTPIYIEDVDSDPTLEAETRVFMKGMGTHAALVIPLIIGLEWQGVIAFEWAEPHAFSTAIRDLIESVMPTTSSVIASRRAYLQTQVAREQAERRSVDMETVAQVSATATTILNIDELLKTVSNLTKERFNLYHAHIYLMDETGEKLVLAAGAGEAGDVMKERGHFIPLNREHSLVAICARERHPNIVNDVTLAPDFLPNPLLPQTRSELALPMIVADKVVGVLDVQDNHANRFTDEDVRVQIALANQVAVAVENGRAFLEQQKTAERLREVDKLKSQFLANMSHELRTPLNSIIGYAEVLLDGIDGDLNEEATEDVKAIHGGGKHLLTIINDILDLAKIEAGQMFIEPRETSLMPVIEDVIHTCEILARNKGIQLNVTQQTEIPTVKGDAIRLKQIILNLVNNAIKFTDSGSVTVDLNLDTPSMVKVRVVDTGMGMNENELQGLFQQFHQVDGSPTRRAGGTGLGLVITRHLVTMHGGVVSVESKKGEGTTFWFTVPVYSRSSQTIRRVMSTPN